ncbi:hypothetical protein M976_02724 [Buttiauxella ferragutiae ATCC 51602]|uniref:Uncharacterized protein n=1 Tax=Buttiauxella ferragutiae ATCC 51602 TaxID=1354252 RepID=A0ABX2W6U5_9ENTR|nr:hypothetical protein M976_02724 [Buttiauxella ferragutiae ATCC 51602]
MRHNADKDLDVVIGSKGGEDLESLHSFMSILATAKKDTSP